ncbi:hypothetical protein BC941DRAFT_448170 [Chlamydoabsidia padenii]|nr:hypothetical protein BC941DRAFT_448170 [Chlamydoabsidia padenii]
MEWIYLLTAIQSLGLCLFSVARRLDLADERQRLGFQQRFRNQHGLAQRLVNEQTYNYAERRLAYLSTVSNEIQDAALMILTTLEQFSPGALLNTTQELLSACSIPVPITSISAIHTTMKHVCHVSSHLQLMSCLVQESNNNNNNNNSRTSNDDSVYDGASEPSRGTHQVPLQSHLRQSFDIGDFAQNTGDALAGMASKLDVNMVLYHSDNSLYHTRIIGDEAAFRHALLSLMRNILEGSTPGACIELGLNLTPVENDKKKVTVTFEITHTCSPFIPDHLSSAAILLPNTKLTTQLVRYVGGRLSINNLTNSRTRFDMSVEVDLDNDSDDDRLLFIGDTSTISGTASPLHKSYHHIKFATEPTMKELTKFMEHLKGLKMVLHAKEQSVFAKHLTGCLASWNSDISHVPVSCLDDNNDVMMTEACSTPGSEEDYSSALTDSVIDYQQQQRHHHHRHHQLHSTTTTTPTVSAATNTISSTTSSVASYRSAPTTAPHVPSPATEEEHILSIPPTFVLIDDHIMTLEHKLLEFRTHPPVSVLPAHGRRHKHSKKNQSTTQHHGPTTAIIHFTSLANYKRVRDTIQWASTLSTPFAMPRVVVVPKPAGPRRYLTALHTVWHNAMVEPHFIPIATSPSSPVPTVLLSSMLSQVVDHPSSITPPTPNNNNNDQHHQHHQHLHPHRPRRPVSGGYSPSFIQMQLQQHEGSNYFFDHRSGSPLFGSRRRSQHEVVDPVGDSVVGETLIDHATRPSISSSGSNLPLVISSATEESTLASVTTKQLSIGQDLPVVTAVAQDIGNNESSKSIGSSSPLTDPGTTKPEPTKTTPTRLAKSIKINKRRKKDKGSPFANVVSPPINVLIVEDNMINQAILSAWMKKHKIKFSVASNGQEAVEKWKGGGFHLILMDIQLPVMSGIDATKTIRTIEKEQKIGVLPMSSCFLRQRQKQQLRQTNSTGDTTTNPIMAMTTSSSSSSINSTSSSTNDNPISPLTSTPSTFRSPVIIVALTASSLESDRHAALAAGCNDFLTKPVSLEWLEKKIIEWGCMQALIDFEGWRRWKRSTHDDDVSSWTNKVSQQGGGGATNITPHRGSLILDVMGYAYSRQDGLSPLPSVDSNSNDLLSSFPVISGAVDKNESGLERKGVLLPGAIGWNKRRFSTVDKQQGLRRHNTTSANQYQRKYSSTTINRTASFSRFPIQKSYSASIPSTPGVRRQTTKKAVSMDDTMKSVE